MLDTIKLAIPITKGQHGRLTKEWLKSGAPQWGLFNPCEGEISLKRIRHLMETDQNSFHRELRFDFPERWAPNASLVIEFSLPKLWYGHNVHLLYGWLGALELLKERIELQFRLTRMKLPPIDSWRVLRADACYNWKFPSQAMAQAYLDSLKALKFPWKQAVRYDTSILFPGATYSVKLYLKLPEFKSHDRKALLKQDASLSWVDYLEGLAEGVLRFELTLRHRWLKERKIRTVADLGRSEPYLVWENSSAEYLGEDLPFGLLAVANNLGKRGQHLISANYSAFKPGELLTAPPGHYHLSLDGQFKGTLTLENEIGFRIYPGGTILSIIQEMLSKLVGEGSMLSNHQVLEQLRAVYRENKAARLTAFWVFVQEFGVTKAKEAFGKDSFYDSRSDLKKAGIDLIERPDNVVFLDDKFWHRFKLSAPSEQVTNRYDDHRDSGNVLNLPRQA